MTKTEKTELQGVQEALDRAENTWDRVTCGQYIREAMEKLKALTGEPVPAEAGA